MIIRAPPPIPEMLDPFIALVIIGLVPATIAKRKGYSFFLFWALGVSLLFVALPLTIFMRRRGHYQINGSWVAFRGPLFRAGGNKPPKLPTKPWPRRATPTPPLQPGGFILPNPLPRQL